MRYLIAGNVAMLSSRNVTDIEDNTLRIKTVGISPIATGPTVSIQKDGSVVAKHYSLVDGEAVVPLFELNGAGNYSVTFSWQEKDPNTGDVKSYNAYGNSFQILKINGKNKYAPSYTHTTSDIDTMWNGVVNLMEALIPFIEQYKYGNDAV